jgi:UDP-2,3-diacylglucosamine pyrophosphatase LpxH
LYCIVVSDVHLGSKSCNYKQFCEFLKWVRKLEDQEEPIKCEDKEVAITSPEKFILLGDILELWDPKDGDRDNVVRQSIRPFSPSLRERSTIYGNLKIRQHNRLLKIRGKGQYIVHHFI